MQWWAIYTSNGSARREILLTVDIIILVCKGVPLSRCGLSRAEPSSSSARRASKETEPKPGLGAKAQSARAEPAQINFFLKKNYKRKN